MSVFNQERVRKSREAIKDCREAVVRMHESSHSIAKEIKALKDAGSSCQLCSFRKRMKLMDFCTKGRIIKPIKLYNICISFKEKEQND